MTTPEMPWYMWVLAAAACLCGLGFVTFLFDESRPGRDTPEMRDYYAAKGRRRRRRKRKLF